MAVQGATPACVFEAYVERLLAPTLRPGQLVVMDNLGAHRPKRIRHLIESRGCELIYLPPYSPDLNPIQEAFGKIKAPTQEDRRPHQGGPDRGDGSSIGSRECSRRAGVLHPLWLPRPRAAAMKGALREKMKGAVREKINTPTAVLIVTVAVSAVNSFLVFGYYLPKATTTFTSPPIAESRARDALVGAIGSDLGGNGPWRPRGFFEHCG
jgi:hypothetical protein